MSTASRVLDANVNGTVYTANVNYALEALDTCHSGATPPTDEVANGKLWFDTSTTPGILRVYNNAAWESVVNLDNVTGATGQALSPTDSPTFANATITTKLTVGSIDLGGTAIVASASDINKLSGLTASTADMNTASTHYVPSGGIIMWSGSVASIPAGWVLCNGGNNTPDLRNRFVIGAGSSYNPGNTGGSSTRSLSSSNLPAHTHSASLSGTTSSAGNHRHSLKTYYDANANGSDAATAYQNYAGKVTNTEYAGAHTHTVTVSGTTGSAGSGSAFNILNPYYALAFIMKT